jgi:hypothetical protein
MYRNFNDVNLNNMSITYKSIDWSYASSPNAVKSGNGNTGCWTVSTHCGNDVPLAVFHHQNVIPAMFYADCQLAYIPFGKWWEPLVAEIRAGKHNKAQI